MSEIVEGDSDAINMIPTGSRIYDSNPTGSKVFPNNFKLLEIWIRSIYGNHIANCYSEEKLKKWQYNKDYVGTFDIRHTPKCDVYIPNIFAETLSNYSLIIIRTTVHNIPDNFNLMKNLTSLYLFNDAGRSCGYTYNHGIYAYHEYIANRSLISEIPDCICELPKLSTIWISCASIKEINPNVSKLINLKELLLVCLANAHISEPDDNLIEDVPDEIYELPKLENLYLKGNPISDSKIHFIEAKLMFNIEFKKIIK